MLTTVPGVGGMAGGLASQTPYSWSTTGNAMPQPNIVQPLGGPVYSSAGGSVVGGPSLEEWMGSVPSSDQVMADLEGSMGYSDALENASPVGGGVVSVSPGNSPAASPASVLPASEPIGGDVPESGSNILYDMLDGIKSIVAWVANLGRDTLMFLWGVAKALYDAAMWVWNFVTGLLDMIRRGLVAFAMLILSLVTFAWMYNRSQQQRPKREEKPK
jgi:hypothetical protein